MYSFVATRIWNSSSSTTTTTGNNGHLQQVVKRHHCHCRQILPVPQQQPQQQPQQRTQPPTILLPNMFTKGNNQLSIVYSNFHSNNNSNHNSGNVRYFVRSICNKTTTSSIVRYYSMGSSNSVGRRNLHTNQWQRSNSQKSNSNRNNNNNFFTSSSFWKKYHPRRIYNKVVLMKRRYQLWGMMIGILTIGSIIKVVYFKYSRQLRTILYIRVEFISFICKMSLCLPHTCMISLLLLFFFSFLE
jgi:hypothetical protein